MITLQQAWDILKGIELFTKSERINIASSNKRFAFKDIQAEFDAPPFTKSRFDGFALGEIDEGNIYYKIAENTAITAGNNGRYFISRGEAVPIMTGAPLPVGTRRIVPLEVCKINGKLLSVEKFPEKERMILKKGSDFFKGQVFLKRGEQINPIHVAYLALDGRDSVEVFSLPLISIVSSGDELSSLSMKYLKKSKIRNSHPPFIQALLSPYAIVKYQTSVIDNIERIKESLKVELHSKCDVIITTGGMGSGVKDLTRKAIHDLGAAPLFEGIDAVPIGTFSCYQYKNKFIFSLPGGMVGVLLLTKLFILPFIKKIQGHEIHDNIGPFLLARLRDKIRYPNETDKRVTTQTVRFIKSRLWEESGERFVIPLDSVSLLKMNAFIVLEYNKKPGQKVPVFQLWHEQND